MATELIINASLPETRIALLENGEIQELLIERASGKGIVGNIYKGRVTRVLPGMQAAFVDIGLEKAAFLYVDDVFVHREIFDEEEGGDHDHDDERSEGSSESTPARIISPVIRAIGTEQSAPMEDVGEEILSAESTLSGNYQGEGSEAEENDDEEEDADHIHLRASEEDEAAEELEALGTRSEADLAETDLAREAREDAEDAEDAAADAAEDAREAAQGSEEDEEDSEEDTESGESNESPMSMGSESGETGTISERASASVEGAEGSEGSEGPSEPAAFVPAPGKRHRRGRRGGRNRRRGRGGERTIRMDGAPTEGSAIGGAHSSTEHLPGAAVDQLADHGTLSTDRQELEGGSDAAGRPRLITPGQPAGRSRPEFKEPRGRDRKIKGKGPQRASRQQVNIQDLLQEGQEILVQVAKDPISTKGARLTCHISLPGRHLVCMPTIDHVGVSRRIDRDEERRRLRDFVEKNRPKKLGFIVRTASGKSQSEKRLKQDIDYLARLWEEIREKSSVVSAPALVYEDLNAILRSVRDWVTEEIDRVVVDSRFHYNEIQKFVSHFMPSIKQKVEVFGSETPIFDSYGISPELSRALERKVWLKSGGYLVIDQAEAMVAIDVNTGRFVGKKNLEDTILKTNLEAVQEIAYQLRLRNCGGIIILDLIDMEREDNKQRVYKALEEALKKDRSRPSIMKISDLGLVEMTRKRTRDTITRTMCETCTHCEGKGYIKSKQTVGYEILREIERFGNERYVSKILVQANADVIDHLAVEERDTLDQIERKYRKQIYLQEVADYHPEQYEVVVEKPDNAGRSEQKVVRGGRNPERENRESRERGGRDRNSNNRGRNNNRNTIVPVTAVSVVSQMTDAELNQGDEEGQESQAPMLPQPSRIQPARIIAPRKVDAASGDGQSAQNDDPESVGNRLGGISPNGNEGNGNSIIGGNFAPNMRHTHDDFMSEEDRLAFLRAQATQDAALARLGFSPNSQIKQGPGAQSGFHAQGGGRGDREGGRGGRGGRGDKRRGRGGRGGRGGSGGGRFGGRGGQGGVERGNAAPGAPIPRAQASIEPSDSGNGGGDDNA